MLLLSLRLNAFELIVSPRQVCLLVTEGKEENNLKESLAAKDYTTKKLVTHADVVNCLCESPRLVPSEFDPICVETYMKTGAENQPKESEGQHTGVSRFVCHSMRS